MVIAPDGTLIPVGGNDQLTAAALDASGNPVAGATVAWSSLASGIASVSSTGLVTGNAVGQARVVAASQTKADTVIVVVVDNFTLEVAPAAASVDIGKTAPFSVIARSGAGLQIPAPPVTWRSSAVSIATISATGVATGVTAGTTAITATAGAVVSAPAVLVVRDTSAVATACDGIATVDTFRIGITYGYKAVGLVSDGGFTIDADDQGDLKAVVRRSLAGPFSAAWDGDISASSSASITQKKSSGSFVSTLNGGGPMVAFQGTLPKISFIVDLATCKFHLKGGAFIRTRLNDGIGNVTDQDEFVATVQFSGDAKTWRNGLVLFDDVIAAMVTSGAALNPDRDAVSPLGFATSLARADGTLAGQGSGGYVISR